MRSRFGKLSRPGRRGGAVLEMALALPWLFFFFVGALDLGFFTYALVSVESAARVAALHTSKFGAADSAAACTSALGEMRSLPNVGNVLTTCAADPVVVTATAVNGPDGNPATLVSVTYQSIRLIPIPGVLASQFRWTRAVKMSVR